MYCSENCRNSDWSLAHKLECKHVTPEWYTFSEKNLGETSHTISQMFMPTSLSLRLVNVIGLDVIKKAVLENKPMESLFAKDARTRGFHDGKFQEVTLEALLSLDDKFDENLPSKERDGSCVVSYDKSSHFFY
jgi:hypothetical protein